MPDIRNDDTIAAIATPVGEGGISVLRVSGSAAFEVVSKLFTPKKGKVADFATHTLHLGEIRTPQGRFLDQVILSVFRAPHSYTGEDVLEISSHGGLVVTRQILGELISAGARHAEPGEFTKRAFLNGRIELTQAEAVLDLIRAKSEKSAAAAAEQLAGALSQTFKALKDELMRVYAHLEAFLDFPEEDLEIYSDGEFKARFVKLEKEIRGLAATFARGSLLREGVTAVLAGKPNVGKSSLFNALLARDRALVSEFPGTTRDALEEAVEIGGAYIRLMDTAGLGPAEHPLDRMGMERTHLALDAAAYVLFLVDASLPLGEADRKIFEDLRLADPAKPVLVVANKCDLPACLDFASLETLCGRPAVKISTKTREGLEAVELWLRARVEEGFSDRGGEQITRLRHKNALEAAAASLGLSREAFERGESLELVILDLKKSLDAMRELIGEIYSEDLLGVIFAEFCIGK